MKESYRQQFTEEVGLAFEQFGLTRMRERIALPGERRTYFQIRPNCCSGNMQSQLHVQEQFHQTFAHGPAQMPADPGDQRTRWQEMTEFFQFIQE